jgi:flagellin
MSVVINTNSAATMAADNLAQSSLSLQKSLNRLSSGSRIVSPEDDAGGLAVSMKLTATAHRQAAVANNIGNATSFLQTQDGVLNVVGKVLSRMSELRTLYDDPTKNTTDKANYNVEFTQLQSQLTSLSNEKFNGVSLFGSTGLDVGVTADSSAINVGSASLMGQAGVGSLFSDQFADLSNWTTQNSVNATGGAMVLACPGTIATATTNQSFSGALDITFGFQFTGGTDVGFLFGGSYVGGFQQGVAPIGAGDTSSHTAKIHLDGAGNSALYLDGSATAVTTKTGVSTSGQFQFFDNQNAGGTVKITNFDVAGTLSGSNTNQVSAASDLGSVSLSQITSALQDVASMRADNGASQSRSASPLTS